MRANSPTLMGEVVLGLNHHDPRHHIALAVYLVHPLQLNVLQQTATTTITLPHGMVDGDVDRTSNDDTGLHRVSKVARATHPFSLTTGRASYMQVSDCNMTKLLHANTDVHTILEGLKGKEGMSPCDLGTGTIPSVPLPYYTHIYKEGTYHNAPCPLCRTHQTN